MIISIPLNKIKPNPWQTRIGEPDPEYIRELAQDIAEHGLLQMPVGRLLSPDGSQDESRLPANQAAIDDRLEFGGCIIQLAFGHNRLAAYAHMLAMSADTGKDRWQTMPVDIRTLTDEQMAEVAWSENEQRRDVTPIERAHAISKRMADFNWSQQDVADHLGLARPTVSNILRLLKLPEEIQAAVSDGRIWDGQVELDFQEEDKFLKWLDLGWIEPSVREAQWGRFSRDYRG